jgi:transposase
MVWRNLGDLVLSKKQLGRGSKYTDAFKQKLVAESRAEGVTVPMVTKKHGVPTSRIYSWRGDPRFQPPNVDTPEFTPIEVIQAAEPFVVVEPTPAEPRIEITLENGRKLSISDGVDAGFVLELARGLAA